MRFPCRRSETRSAFLRMERCREIDGPEIAKRAAISPAAISPSLRSWRICRRVGSASALKVRETFFMHFEYSDIAKYCQVRHQGRLAARRETSAEYLRNRVRE